MSCKCITDIHHPRVTYPASVLEFKSLFLFCPVCPEHLLSHTPVTLQSQKGVFLPFILHSWYVNILCKWQKALGCSPLSGRVLR